MALVKSVEFIGHPVFRDVKFDFCRADGSVALDVVFAGENGSGKTRLLEEIYYGTKREYTTDAKVRAERQTIIELDLSDSDFYDLDNPHREVTGAKLIASSDSDSVETFYKVEFYGGDELVPRVGERSKHNQVTSFSLNSAYSMTEINYLAKNPVTGVTNETLDSGILEESSDVARDVTQLLIDIASQDNDEIALAVRENPEEPVPKSLLEGLRMKRFSRAFYTMFGSRLKYKTVRENIVPIFEKEGAEVELNSLSSGEKQIVFRSTYLLRNIKNLAGAPILIDEPELSMHPKWARKVYEFYKNLFVVRGRQASQVFMATHSADIVGAAIEDESAVVVSLCLDCGAGHKYSRTLTDEILPTTTIAELKYFIFGIPSTDFHIQLYSYLQNTFTKGLAVRTVDEFLVKHGAPRKKSMYKGRGSVLVYRALPTYIRNAIDHPEKDLAYSEDELRESIEFMVGLVRELRKGE